MNPSPASLAETVQPASRLLPGFTRPAALLFLLLSLENFCFNAAHNSLSLLAPWLGERGAGKTFLGLFGTLNTLVMLVFLIGFPKFLVRVPKVPVLGAGFGLLILGNILVLVFPGSLAWILFCRVLGSFSFVFSYSLLMSMVYTICPPGSRAGTIALFGISGLISNAVASLGGEAVLRLAGGTGIWIFSASFGLLALAGLAVIGKSWPRYESPLPATVPSVPPSPAPTAPQAPASPADSVPASPAAPPPSSLVPRRSEFVLGLPRTFLRQPHLRRLMALSFMFGSAFAAWMAYLPALTGKAQGGAGLSAFTLPFAAVSITMRLGFSRKLDTARPRTLLTVCFGAMTLAFSLMILPFNPWTPWFCGALYGFGHSILFPLLSSLHVKAGREDQKTAFNNAFILTNSSGALILVPLGGLIGDLYSIHATFAWFAVLAGGSTLALFIKPVPRQKQQSGPPGKPFGDGN